MFGCRPSPATKKSTGSAADARQRLLRLYERAFAHFGPLHWWPGETPLEVCVGAILTQNTAWTNVEKAIANLQTARLLGVRAIHEVDDAELAAAIRPSGYYNQKAKKLKTFAAHIIQRHRGSLTRLLSQRTAAVRAELLALNGIGPETADSMILYAANQPIFVVDAYTRRILHRAGLVAADAGYDELQALFHRHLPRETQLYNEFHAQLVYLGKEFCRKRSPDCAACPARLAAPGARRERLLQCAASSSKTDRA
jgi:endonuclease-3 related protein